MKSYYKGKLAGTIGHAASFSFQSSKHLTAGEGGMVITDKNLALDVRRGGLGYSGISPKKEKLQRIKFNLQTISGMFRVDLTLDA